MTTHTTMLIEWLDLCLKCYTNDWPTLNASDDSKASDAIAAIRAKLIAADDMAKALERINDKDTYNENSYGGFAAIARPSLDAWENA